MFLVFQSYLQKQGVQGSLGLGIYLFKKITTPASLKKNKQNVNETEVAGRSFLFGYKKGRKRTFFPPNKPPQQRRPKKILESIGKGNPPGPSHKKHPPPTEWEPWPKQHPLKSDVGKGATCLCLFPVNSFLFLLKLPPISLVNDLIEMVTGFFPMFFR